MSRRRRGHRHDAVPAAARSSTATASASSPSTSTGTGAPTARASMADYDDFYDVPAARRASCRARRSRRSATSSRSTSRCSRRRRHRLDPPLRRDLRHGALGRAGARRARRARRRRRAGSSCSTRAPAAPGHGLMAVAAANAAEGRRRRAGRGRRGEALRRADEDPVRRRHARVPAPRRADRRRAGVARLGAEDQADPLDRERDHRRSSACAPQGRAIERLVRELREQRDAGADVFFIQHVQAPERGRAARRRAAARSTAREPEFVSEIGPVIGTHTGPGLVGVTASRQPCSAACCGAASGQDPRRGANHPGVSAPAPRPLADPCAVARARSCASSSRSSRACSRCT